MNKVERMKSLIRQKWASQLVVGHYKSREHRRVAYHLGHYLLKECASLKYILMNALWWAASDEYYDWEPIYQEASGEPLRG